MTLKRYRHSKGVQATREYKQKEEPARCRLFRSCLLCDLELKNHARGITHVVLTSIGVLGVNVIKLRRTQRKVLADVVIESAAESHGKRIIRNRVESRSRRPLCAKKRVTKHGRL